MAPGNSESRDVALAPGIFAHVQDTNRGVVLTYVGPVKINQKDQDRPVVYDATTRTFTIADAQRCIRNIVHVDEGEYVVLRNPALAENGTVKFPKVGDGPQEQPVLASGQYINIPGPVDFALWPEQSAEVIEGHILRSDQYLLVRVTDSAKAKQNWAKAVAQTADGEEAKFSDMDFTTGALNVIKGTECKFFIPCTGLEVLKEPHISNRVVKDYVRDAIGLETLEYCILLDENGGKRYERGTKEGKTVFPKPTEHFYANEQGNTVFRAYELNQISGVHVKVIADYTDEETKVAHKAGEELFITGEGMIYFPRAEHAIIKYGNHARHYATAIPPGEGRYVLNRLTGEIRTIVGPQMVLLNPIEEVFVKRPLSRRECELMYPGNTVVLQHNLQLADKAAAANVGYVAQTDTSANLERTTSITRMMGVANKLSAAPAQFADTITRSTSYTPPRTVTLNTKLEGAVAVDVWPGYAITVVDKRGGRRVVQGRATVILAYDESLEMLQMSTGKPKNTDRLEETVYLRVLNNKVSDIVAVQTSDHVEVQLKVSYRVNFEGDPNKWFAVDNYVKLLCDHIRSVLKSAVRKMPIKDFYANSISVVRDVILGVNTGDGVARKGMTFSENGMRVIDVDVLGTVIADPNISRELVMAQHDAIAKTLELENSTRQVELDKAVEALKREAAMALAETAALKAQLELERLDKELAHNQFVLQAELACEKKRLEIADAKQAIQDLCAARELIRDKADAEQEHAVEVAEQTLRLEAVEKETAAIATRLQAAGPGLTAAVAQLSDTRLVSDVAKAMGPIHLLSGGTFLDTVRRASPVIGERIAHAMASLVGNETSTLKEDVE